MDLGLAGRKAIVCGASRGLGYGCAAALVAEGVDVWIAARDQAAIREAVDTLAALNGGRVEGVAADVASEAGRAALLAACPSPDILVTNAGGPPPGDFREWGRDQWIAALDANMLSGIELIRVTIDGMIGSGFGRIINITSHMVKQPVGFLGLSNGARAGLTGFVGGLARDVAGDGVTINNLLPGQFETARLRGNHEKFAARTGADITEFRNSMRKAVPAGRFGDPAEFGATCAFLCSVHAGFITGQNLLLDGGQYPGLL